MPWLKAEVDDDSEAEAYIEHLQEQHGWNRVEAVEYIIEESAREWEGYDV